MTNRAWIQEKLLENSLNVPKVSQYYPIFKKEQGSTMTFASFKRRIFEVKEELTLDDLNLEDNELDKEELTTGLVKKSAQLQKVRDLKNQEVKIKREGERLYNILEERFTTLIDSLESVNLSNIKLPKIKNNKSEKYGILQLSDLHANEIILPSETHNMNEYNFDILSKRLRKYILESINLFKTYNMTDIYLILTGDLLNSSRRLSEKLAQSTSLAKASLLLTFLIEQAILELRQKGFRIHVTSIVGNESRLSDFMESNEMTASENWDFLVFNSLRHLFKNVNGVEFIVPDNQIMSLVNMPNGFNFLITHGHTLKGGMEKNIGRLLQNYNHRGIPVHAIFVGHQHNASIGDFASRSSSLCGANAYSSNDLMFLTRSSHNSYIVNEDLSYHGMKFDLQNVEDVEGYNIAEELETYIPKSYNKEVMKTIQDFNVKK